MVHGLWFRVWGLGLRAQDSELRVHNVGLKGIPFHGFVEHLLAPQPWGICLPLLMVVWRSVV
jgi:hypothetical protein